MCTHCCSNQTEEPDELPLNSAEVARALWLANKTSANRDEQLTQRTAQSSRQEGGYALLNPQTMMVHLSSASCLLITLLI